MLFQERRRGSSLKIRIPHLSDFHVGKDELGITFLIREILNHVKEKLGKERAPDLVLLTGDLANTGRAEEFKQFNDEFLQPLNELLKDKGTRFFMIPGNHDLDREKNPLAQRYDALNLFEKFFDPSLKGLTLREELFSRFKAFTENDSGIDTRWLVSEAGVLTEVVSFMEGKLGILGLNTAWLSGGDRDQENLTPGSQWVKFGLASLEDRGCDQILVLGHHPLSWFEANERAKIEAGLSKAGAIYIRGHMHKARIETGSLAGRQFLTLQSGAAFQARDHALWVNGLPPTRVSKGLSPPTAPVCLAMVSTASAALRG